MAKINIDKTVIRELAGLLEETGLSEIEWSEGDVLIRVSRDLGGTVKAITAPTVAATASTLAEASTATEPAAEEDFAKHPGAVVSPMVGTAYTAPEPGAEPFVRVGDQVAEGATVMIVEAMKTMNPIPAPRAGTIKQILVENEQPVEYGQVLMLIE